MSQYDDDIDTKSYELYQEDVREAEALEAEEDAEFWRQHAESWDYDAGY